MAAIANRGVVLKLAEALDQANALVIPEILAFEGFSAQDAERRKNEEALACLRETYNKEENPIFGWDTILDLAQRNRELCDSIGIARLSNARDTSLARSLTDEDLCKGIAAMQKRRSASVIKKVGSDTTARSFAYLEKPAKATVLGIDIETTDRYPDRGYIINVGFCLMELGATTEPYDGQAYFCGLPSQYESSGVPLEEIHHIGWSDVAGKLPFRQDKSLQKQILTLMKKYPYMAHNAAFEDSWFMLNLDGYAEARKAGKITVIDSRDICRLIDPEVKSLPRESAPAALENWAKRRGVLNKSDKEVHQGLDDTELMLRTVQAEFKARGMWNEDA